MRSIAFCIKQLYASIGKKAKLFTFRHIFICLAQYIKTHLDDKKENLQPCKKRSYTKIKLMVAAKCIQQFIEQILWLCWGCFINMVLVADCWKQSQLFFFCDSQMSDNAVRNDPLTLLIASFMQYHTPRGEQTCLTCFSCQGSCNQSRWSPPRVTSWTGCEPTRTNVLVLQLSVLFRSKTSQVGLHCGGKWIYWD